MCPRLVMVTMAYFSQGGGPPFQIHMEWDSGQASVLSGLWAVRFSHRWGCWTCLLSLVGGIAFSSPQWEARLQGL